MRLRGFWRRTLVPITEPREDDARTEDTLQRLEQVAERLEQIASRIDAKVSKQGSAL